MKNQIRVFSVDDHPLVREGIASVINSQPDMQVVAQASDGRQAISYFNEQQPDVTLMDIRLPDMSGIDAMIAIRTKCPEARIIMLTTFDGDSEIQRALSAGARSYILKSMPPRDMADTIRQVHAGKKCMSQTPLHLQDHLTVIIGQCDMLEDIFSARSEVMTRINVIRNAAHRIANAIECQSWPPSEMFAEDRRVTSTSRL